MKARKTLILFTVVLTVLVLFASCQKKTTGLEEVKNSGKLVIATSPDFPPFEYLEGGEVVGIEVDILSLIAEKLSVKLEINQMDFDSVLPGVQSGKFDVGVSGISITEKRKKNVLFSSPYCLAAQAIVVTETSTIKSKDDLEGKKISVQTGTTAESYTMEMGYTVSSFTANSDAEMALVQGKVDAWVIDDLTAYEMVEAYNKTAEIKLVILEDAMTTEPYAFAFSLDNEDLVNEINTILSSLLSDGTIEKIFKKYNAPYTKPEPTV